MSFVCERLNEDDKKYIKSFDFHMPLGNVTELINIPDKWVSDRDKGYYMICIAGRGYFFDEEYPPYFYKLIIDNKVIEINARYQSSGNYASGVEMTWRLESICVLGSLNHLSELELLNIIKNAFIAYGNVHKSGHVISTVFERISAITYITEKR